MKAKLRPKRLSDGPFAASDDRYEVQQPHGMDPEDPNRQCYVVVLAKAVSPPRPFPTWRDVQDWLARQSEQETGLALTVSKPELDTILAALRLWQGRSFGERSLDLRDNASDGNAHRLLSEDEIDERCERLNTSFSSSDQSTVSQSLPPGRPPP